jgi:hypothetical protein
MSIVLLSKPPIIPGAIKVNCLAWWDASKLNDVYYSMTQIEYETDGTGLTDVFGTGNVPTATEFTAIKAADQAAGNPAEWEGTRPVKCNPGGKYYWHDYSGNGRHSKLSGISYNGTTSGWLTGPPKTIIGDAFDDWIGHAQSGLIAQDADFSYMCCFSPSTDNAITRLEYNFTTDFTTGAVVNFYYDAGSLSVNPFDRISGSALTSYAMSILSSSYYIVGYTYTQSDKKFRIYVNGVLVATSVALTNGHAAINYDRHFRNQTGTSYTGQKLGFRTYFNKALSGNEAKLITNSNCTRFSIAKVI